jgi:hypothetical protein
MIVALALLSLGMPAQAAAACPSEIVEPERRFSGIYVDDFEGQRFFEGAAGIGDLDFRARPIVNFEPDIVGVGKRFGITQRANGLAYRVTFRGVMRSRGTVGRPRHPVATAILAERAGVSISWRSSASNCSGRCARLWR